MLHSKAINLLFFGLRSGNALGALDINSTWLQIRTFHDNAKSDATSRRIYVNKNNTQLVNSRFIYMLDAPYLPFSRHFETDTLARSASTPPC
jgi:hypothetical protein